MTPLHIIMPVKDSLDTATEALRALTANPAGELTVYDDFSTPTNAALLDQLSAEGGFRVHHWADHTDHPSPNYRLTLQHAQQQALAEGAHLVVVESDVTVQPDTLTRLAQAVDSGVGMVAAVTVDEQQTINFPYLYARRLQGTTVSTRRRLSFCCTLLTHDFLRSYDFAQLDPTKQWFDVFLSHESLALGFRNLLMLDNQVLHRPHSSRPWKQLKYSQPLRYYLQKLIQQRDRI